MLHKHRAVVLYNHPVMPTLAELRRKARTITVNWAVDNNTTVPIQVTYDPGKITMASQDIPDDGKTLHDFWEEKYIEYVKSHDIMDDDGNPVPITPEGIAKLETAMVQVVLTSIQEDARPNPTNTTST